MDRRRLPRWRKVGRRIAQREKDSEKGSEARYGEVEGDGSTMTGCREPVVALRFAERVGSSLDSSSPGEPGARDIYSS